MENQLPRISETVALTFKRMPYQHVSEYIIYNKSPQDENYKYLASIANPPLPNLVETLVENVLVENGYIKIPEGYANDMYHPPIVMIDDVILTDADFQYSAYLKTIKLASHLNPTEANKVDLICLEDLVKYEYVVEHDLLNVTKYEYYVEPIYKVSHEIGNHNIIM